MIYLTMLVIFHVNVIICQIFNLPQIDHIFAKKITRASISGGTRWLGLSQTSL
jgi:hypothetical protein